MNATGTAREGRISQQAEEALRRAESWMKVQQRRRRLIGEEGRLDAVTESGGGRSVYRYDSCGDLVEIVEPDGRRSTFAYDARRRLQAVHRADGTESRYVYDGADRFRQVFEGGKGRVRRYEYDDEGRLERIAHGATGTSVFRYDASGRIELARTSCVTTRWEYDAASRISRISRSLDGVVLSVRFAYDAQGRLCRMHLPGLESPIGYEWDQHGKPAAVKIGDDVIARVRYDVAECITRLELENGVEVERSSDGRPLTHVVRRGDRCLLNGRMTYGDAGPISDGTRTYAYDTLGRLITVRDETTGSAWRFSYDAMDNRTSLECDGRRIDFDYDAASRLTAVREDGAPKQTLTYDDQGRIKRRVTPEGTISYRFDDADRLVEVRRGGQRLARFVYDHQGLLARADVGSRSERYVYGPANELVAVTDDQGRLKRAFVYTPIGPLVSMDAGADGSFSRSYLHADARGTLAAVTDSDGRLETALSYSPYGIPTGGDRERAQFGGHIWIPEIGLYYCLARWYDPYLARFISPDSYTGAPDDERLLMPVGPASRQAALRTQLLGDWLKQPRVRNRYAYCGNDPVGRADPNGHWSVGWVILSILGAIWTLPNTLIGLVIEISCLVLEALRWVLFGITFGNVRWEDLESPGFDAAASGRLNAFAIVFEGGWIGSFDGLLAITFGNVFFVNPDWDQHAELGGPGDVFPSAYNGTVAIPRREALYEHELRHVNHQSWIGPFYYLGLPIWGFFFWDLMINGYCNMVLERDARARAGV